MESPSTDVRSPQRWLKYGGLLLLVSVTVAAGIWWRNSRPDGTDRPVEPADQKSQLEDDSPPDPFISPYKNTRLDVKYVGDKGCLSCHREMLSYHQHPMGQSFATVTHALPLEQYGSSPCNPLTVPGLQLSVERKDGHILHKVVYQDAKGKPIEGVEPAIHEARYAMGSGTQGRSYLVEQDGALFMSPISWFTRKKDWGLSPGYEYRFFHFQRPIPPRCVYCHADRAEPVKDSVNRYRTPVFKSFSIGCERCHGPGELHVAGRLRRDQFGPVDYTIVNPRRLEPSLRDAVCQQCHLQGEQVITRRGKTEFDYRPGLPLHDFVTVFVRPPHLSDQLKAVSHIEQLRVSQCSIRSAGKLGCISCHDPHYLPREEERVSYYRGDQKDEQGQSKRGCYSCHTETSCQLKPAERRRRNPQDSCIDCHMPARPGVSAAHSAVTDHRILRDPNRPIQYPVLDLPPELPILRFHQDLVKRDPDAKRDLAVAMITLARSPANRFLHGETIPRKALPLLKASLTRHPDDLPAWEARGHASWILKDYPGSLDAFAAILKHSPQHEEALVMSARIEMELGKLDEAVDHARRLVELNPWLTPNQNVLSDALIRSKQWEQAIVVIRKTLQVHPADTRARQHLINYHFHLGDKEAARVEFGRIVSLNPPDLADIQMWYDKQCAEK